MVKRFLQDKRLVLLLSLLGVISLVLLAGAMNHITFRPAKPLYRPEQASQEGGVSLAQVIERLEEIPLWKQVAAVVSVILVMVLVFLMLTPEARKRLLRMFIRGALALLAVYFILKKNPDLLKGLFPQFNYESGEPDPNAMGPAAPPVFEPPQVSDTLSFLITLGIVVVAAIAAWLAYRWWRQHSYPPTMLEDLAKVARNSLRELSQRGASHDAIIRCYENMNDAVFARRGLQREYTMTAAEFAQRLQDAGLPREPVNRLTRLFESARYSSHTSTQRDIDEAVSCLTMILQFCGEKA